MNHSIEEALDSEQIPRHAAGRIAKTAVTGLNVSGFGISLGKSPHPRNLPDIPELRLDALVSRLARQVGQKILLMLDEVQTLADFPGELVATLRAVLHRRSDVVAAVFTGSSQEGLARLMTTAGAPMYQFAQLIVFPVLGDEYLLPLCKHFRRVHPGKHIDLDQLRALFAKIGHKPALLRDIVKNMSAEGIEDPVAGLRQFVNDDRNIAVWQAMLNILTEFDRAYLAMIGQGMPPLAKSTLEQLAQTISGKVTLSKARASLNKLLKMRILAKTGKSLVFDDPLLAEYLAQDFQSTDSARH